MNQEQKESLNAYQKASLDYYKKRKKKRLKIIFISVFSFFILKIFIR